MEEKKEKFLQQLKAAGGIICVACENSGISRGTYYLWRDSDSEFRQAAEDIMEMQIDFVESKLMSLIKNGDTTATIFYLKTKGKKRGYSEKVLLAPSEPEQAAQPALTAEPIPVEEVNVSEEVKKRISKKRDHIVKMLKKQGKYTAELSMQVNIVAQLSVRTELLAEEIFESNHKAINVEYSREGNERESISPKEKLYLDYLQQTQKALRALGMNTDARERKTDNDGFSEFMKEFKGE